ncbi:MAG: hypothetical protein WKF80_01935 [Thermomicrobiales bacterium]
MNARLTPVPRDPIGRRDPAAVEMVGLGFAAVVRHPVAVVSMLIAELIAGTAITIAAETSPGHPIGTGIARVIDRFVIVLSPVLATTAPLRDVVSPGGGVPSAVQSPVVGWTAVIGLAVVALALVAGVGLRLTDRPASAAPTGSSSFATLSGLGSRLIGAVVEAAGIALLLGTPVVLAAMVADGANDSTWIVPMAIIGVALLAWWSFRLVADAVVDDQSIASDAVITSARIVMRFPGVALRLFLLGASISLGCRALWIGFVGTPAGLFIALLGNAVVFVGLTAGRATFYREARDIIDAERSDVFSHDAISPGMFTARS